MQSEVIYLTREGDKDNYSGTITWLLEVTRGTVQYVQCCRVAQSLSLLLLLPQLPLVLCLPAGYGEAGGRRTSAARLSW